MAERIGHLRFDNIGKEAFGAAQSVCGTVKVVLGDGKKDWIS